MALDPNELKALYRKTVVVRRPTYGIVSGYHELPYVCIGEAIQRGHRTTVINGKVQVSPRFVIRPSHYDPSYEEIFGAEHMDVAIAGRVFGYLGFRDKPVECKSEYLNVSHVDATVDRVLSHTQDQLERDEDVSTGIIITPDARYFPVSVERFIASVIEDEFSD